MAAVRFDYKRRDRQEAPLQQLARYTFAIISPSRVIFIGVIVGLALSLGFVSCNAISSMMIVISLPPSLSLSLYIASSSISVISDFPFRRLRYRLLHAIYSPRTRLAEIVRAACTVALLLIIIVISRRTRSSLHAL